MSLCQDGILQSPPVAGRYLMLRAAADLPRDVILSNLQRLGALCDGEAVVAGLGARLLSRTGFSLDGLYPLAPLSAGHLAMTVTDWDAVLWLRGTDTGTLFHRSRQLLRNLSPLFRAERIIDAHRYSRGPQGHGLDLSGFEDGIENPSGVDASAVAALRHAGAGLDGSSFMVVQPWEHDWAAFDAMGEQAQNLAIGRRRSDSAELDDAPLSAHVKRTAQEDFDPPAFMLRRSMPWVDGLRGGLVFVAFGASLKPFEVQMRHMLGLDDGVVDGLFQFSRPQGAAGFWCPPVRQGRLDLRALGLGA